MVAISFTNTPWLQLSDDRSAEHKKNAPFYKPAWSERPCWDKRIILWKLCLSGGSCRADYFTIDRLSALQKEVYLIFKNIFKNVIFIIILNFEVVEPINNKLSIWNRLWEVDHFVWICHYCPRDKWPHSLLDRVSSTFCPTVAIIERGEWCGRG